VCEEAKQQVVEHQLFVRTPQRVTKLKGALFSFVLQVLNTSEFVNLIIKKNGQKIPIFSLDYQKSLHKKIQKYPFLV
jgi:hypothetical protein